MRLVILALGLLATICSTSRASPTFLENVELRVGNYIDDLVRKALEYIRTLLQKHDPYPVPSMPQQTVTGEDIRLVATFKNLMVSNASNFVINKIENNVLGFWAKFDVTIPSMHLEGGYEVMGTVKGKAVTGNGNFKLDITKLDTSGYVRVGFASWWLQMTEMDIDYTIEDLKFTETGLIVAGMTQEQIQNLFSQTFLDYFKNNEKYVSSQVADYVKGIANDIMKGKNLKQLLEWLNNVIHGNILPG
ncbi:hypothetical protein GE061_010294 [Apolygus lucorum]|uniref:Lipid-binding serum glycoprotein N-terminal domain-containing protein n=1 Tax=Apolygus lucorum TaxID=248454 RepID=A0A6A4KAJ0_APOLU|nr:hypothetical protein GE061_010294 [Apolygus lucorum]